MRKEFKLIIQDIFSHFPDIQAVYIFGSFSKESELPDSDVDIALLLPVQTAKDTAPILLAEIGYKIKKQIGKDVDLINLRGTTTVFQKEVITTGNRIFCADNYSANEFEMLVLSYYQKLNDERKEIIANFFNSKRAYNI